MKKNPGLLIEQLLSQKEQIIKNQKDVPIEKNSIDKKSSILKKREGSLKKQNLSPKRKKNNSANPLNQSNNVLQNCDFFPIIKNYEILEKIGEGSYGQVYRGKHLPSHTQVAIKIYDKSSMTETRRKSIRFEIGLLLKIDHPHIVKFIDSFMDSKKIYIIMELIQGQNLFHYFKSKFRDLKQEFKNRNQFAFSVLSQLSQVLSFLHKNGINHRDIKLDNLVYDEKKKIIKLVDFGFATIVDPNVEEKVYCGTPLYISPETVLKKYCDTKTVDIWATGVIYYVLLFNAFPFTGNTDEELYADILTGQIKKQKNLNKFEEFILSSTLEKNWRKRITAVNLKKYILMHN